MPANFCSEGSSPHQVRLRLFHKQTVTLSCFSRHQHGDWGDLNEEDKKEKRVFRVE